MNYIDFCTISTLLQHSLVKSETQPCLFSNIVAQEISDQAHISLRLCTQQNKYIIEHTFDLTLRMLRLTLSRNIIIVYVA
jgi:hypothetical protein